MSETRTFSVEKLDSWGLGDVVDSYSLLGGCVMHAMDVYDYDEYTMDHRIIFSPPNDDQAYRVLVRSRPDGRFETDPWQGKTEVETTLVYPHTVTVTEWKTHMTTETK